LRAVPGRPTQVHLAALNLTVNEKELPQIEACRRN
jgi:hypothetical protein